MSEIKDPDTSHLDPKLRSIVDIEPRDDRNFIYCATCSHIISRPSEKIDVNGSHSHHFTNPHGFSFHVGCFANALGCSLSGSPEAADSWFMGFFWRLAGCAECQTHLGWYFSRATGEDFFYGLILDRIQEEPG